MNLNDKAHPVWLVFNVKEKVRLIIIDKNR